MAVTPLHCSLFERCRQQILTDREFLEHKAWSAAPEVDSGLFEEYRLFKLRRMLTYVERHSRFYRKRFAESGIRPEEIQTIGDLAALPLTKAQDLAADPYAFLCVSQGTVERAVTFTSSGTVGPQKRMFFSEADVEAIIAYMDDGIKTVADAGDVVQILLPEGPILGQCDLLARGVKKMGAVPVITGLFASPEEQIAAIKNNGTTVLFGETHLIYRITKWMEGRENLRELGIKTLFLATSYASKEMMRYLRKTWGARVSLHYGLTEMGIGLAVTCPDCGVYHYNQLDVVAEVVNPRTGEPLLPGSFGELAFTSIQYEAMPLIRYRTGDLAFLGNAGEMCVSPLQTISQVPYRMESLISIQGHTFYPTLFHDTLFRIPDVIDYELSVDDCNGKATLFLEIEALASDDLLRQRIIKHIQEHLLVKEMKAGRIEIRVEFKSVGQLQQGRHFKKVIKDLRQAR